MGYFLDRLWGLRLSWGFLSPTGFPPREPTGGSERHILCLKETQEKMKIQSRPSEFPPSHRMRSTMNDSRQAEGGRKRGWVCRQGSPEVSEGPKGPGRASCGYVWDCHSPVALWAKIAQREVGSFLMNKACL